MSGRAKEVIVESSPTRKVAIDKGGKIAQNLYPLAAGCSMGGGMRGPGVCADLTSIGLGSRPPVVALVAPGPSALVWSSAC